MRKGCFTAVRNGECNTRLNVLVIGVVGVPSFIHRATMASKVRTTGQLTARAKRQATEKKQKISGGVKRKISSDRADVAASHATLAAAGMSDAETDTDVKDGLAPVARKPLADQIAPPSPIKYGNIVALLAIDEKIKEFLRLTFHGEAAHVAALQEMLDKMNREHEALGTLLLSVDTSARCGKATEPVILVCLEQEEHQMLIKSELFIIPRRLVDDYVFRLLLSLRHKGGFAEFGTNTREAIDVLFTKHTLHDLGDSYDSNELSKQFETKSGHVAAEFICRHNEKYADIFRSFCRPPATPTNPLDLKASHVVGIYTIRYSTGLF